MSKASATTTQAGGLGRLEHLPPLPRRELGGLELLPLGVPAREELVRAEDREDDRVGAGLERRRRSAAARRRRSPSWAVPTWADDQAGLPLAELAAADAERRRLHAGSTLPRAASRSRATTGAGSVPGDQSREASGRGPPSRGQRPRRRQVHRHRLGPRGGSGEEKTSPFVAPGYGHEHGRRAGGAEELDGRLDSADGRGEVSEEERLDVLRGQVGEARPAVGVGLGEPRRAPQAKEPVAEERHRLAGRATRAARLPASEPDERHARDRPPERLGDRPQQRDEGRAGLLPVGEGDDRGNVLSEVGNEWRRRWREGGSERVPERRDEASTGGAGARQPGEGAPRSAPGHGTARPARSRHAREEGCRRRPGRRRRPRRPPSLRAGAERARPCARSAGPRSRLEGSPRRTRGASSPPLDELPEPVSLEERPSPPDPRPGRSGSVRGGEALGAEHVLGPAEGDARALEERGVGARPDDDPVPRAVARRRLSGRAPAPHDEPAPRLRRGVDPWRAGAAASRTGIAGARS